MEEPNSSIGVEAVDQSIILTGQQTIVHKWMATRSALKLEIRTGLRHSRGSVMLAANKITGSNTRKKRVAYDALNKFMVEHGLEDKPRSEWDK